MNRFRAKILNYEKHKDEIEARNYADENGYIEGYLIGEDVIVGDIIDFQEDYFNTEFWYRIDKFTLIRVRQ